MKRTFASILVWGVMAAVCIVLLSTNAYASSVPVEGFEGGPGVCYDEAGDIVDAELDMEISEDTASGNTKESADASIEEARLAGDNKELEASQYEISAEPAGEAAAEQASEGASAAEASEVSDVAEAAVSSDGTIFTHDGVDYVKGTYWGSHKLTGYSGEQWGTNTASGAHAREGHTVSATSQLPFGTVIIIDGGTGPSVSKYNGVYVVEDRGGSAIEYDGLVDIFFESHADAMAVTDQGWNYAEIWIAVPVSE